MPERLLRTVLVGLLSVSAVACKSRDESPKSQPGVAAGKVVDVGGTVTVRHGEVARALVKGETVEAEDTVETGADGHVTIELAHNRATWELGANKKQIVRESMAWKLAKHEGSAAAGEQDTAAAGRPAERSAADTTASAADEEKPNEEAKPKEEAKLREEARQDAPKAAATTALERAPSRPRAAAAIDPAQTTSAAPPPPKPDPTRASAADSAGPGGGSLGITGKGGGGASADGATDGREGGGGGPSGGGAISGGSIGTIGRGGGTVTGKAKGTGSMRVSPKLVVDTPQDKDLAILRRHEKQLASCLRKDAPEVKVLVSIGADGKATKVVVTGKAAVPAEVTTCVTDKIKALAFERAATTVTTTLAK